MWVFFVIHCLFKVFLVSEYFDSIFEVFQCEVLEIRRWSVCDAGGRKKAVTTGFQLMACVWTLQIPPAPPSRSGPFVIVTLFAICKFQLAGFPSLPACLPA
jgi:hypothetical protein